MIKIISLIDRVLSRIIKTNNTTCWNWAGAHNKEGYSQTSLRGKIIYVHRFMYEFNKGKIPKGYDLDHICRNTGCINPNHLEAVTHRENVIRGVGIMSKKANQTHCINGHEFTAQNTIYRKDRKSGIGRNCRKCKNKRDREYKQRRAKNDM